MSTGLSQPAGVQASGSSPYTQTYSTAGRTNPAMTSGSVATTGATNVTPFGFTTAAQANAIVSAVNALVLADVLDAKKLLNALIDDLQAKGIIT